MQIDKKNEINVYYINQFYGENIYLFYYNIEKCAELFDTNKYPVTLISDFNTRKGWFIIPFITVKFYSSFRKTDEIEDILKDYRGIMFDVKSYENIELEDLIKKEKK